MSASDESKPAAAHTRVAKRGGRLTIGRRLGLLVGLLWLSVAGLTVMAALGVGRIDRDIQDFHDGTFRRAALTVDLRGALKNTEIMSLEYALIDNEPRREKLRARLSGTLIPTVNEALVGTERALGERSDRSDTQGPLRRLRSNWQLYLESAGPALLATDAAGEQAAAVRIRSILDHAIADAGLLTSIVFLCLWVVANLEVAPTLLALPAGLAMWVAGQVRVRRLLGVTWDPLIPSLGELFSRP